VEPQKRQRLLWSGRQRHCNQNQH